MKPAKTPKRGTRINYSRFYRLVRQYACDKISRERFVFEWELERRRKGEAEK
jgi:hypothetical protein